MGDPDHRSDGSAGPERRVDVGRDDTPALPRQTVDDTDRGWGEAGADNDERLLAERPPHWE